MIVAAFLNWATTARSADRAKAASALARAYLQDQLEEEQRDAALTAMAHLVHDVSPRVRCALASVLAPSQHAPRHIILALANDQPDVAAEIILKSDVLSDDDLIEIAASGGALTQGLIAVRGCLTNGICAALCEICEPSAIHLLLENPSVQLSANNLKRLTERFSSDLSLRGALLDQPDLPNTARVQLLNAVLGDMAESPLLAACLTDDRRHFILSESQEMATIRLVEESASHQLPQLVEELFRNDMVSQDLLVKFAALGKGEFVACALAQLTAGDMQRIRKMLETGRVASLSALLRSAGLSPVVNDVLCEVTLFWRRAQPFEGLPALLNHMSARRDSGPDLGQRQLLVCSLDRLVQRCKFEHAQSEVLLIRDLAA